MRLLLHLISGLILIIFLPAISVVFKDYFLAFIRHVNWLPFAAGTFFGIVIDKILCRYLPVAEVFEHEITHALSGLPFGIIPIRIIATRNGGECRQLYFTPRILLPFAIDFVTLAPYIFPTFTVVLILFRSSWPAGHLLFYDLAIGLTFGYHLWSTIRETRCNFTKAPIINPTSASLTETDIAKSGMIFSSIYIVSLSLAIHGVLMAILVEGAVGITHWRDRVWAFTATLIQKSVLLIGGNA